MKWENYVRASENILCSPQVPSSLEIISLIKKVNPTRLALSENDRERGYRLKSRLQSLLLEHYGDTFHLIPHPASQNIILIKHRALPSIDACHADLDALSSEAVERVETAAPLHVGREESKRNRKKTRRDNAAALSPKEALKKAQALLEEYDYAAAEEMLAGVQARGGGDLQVLARAADILLHEVGAYQRCIDIILNQPKNVLRERGIREMLAVAYHRNGCVPEARAILDELNPAELGLDALVAYAEISFKDGNLPSAAELATIAKGKEGFCSALAVLQKEIEAAMSAQAEPVVQKARAAFGSADYAQAIRLAREALDLDPGSQEARAVITAVEAISDEAQLAELWARLENESDENRRLALLAVLLERDRERRDTVRKLMAEEKERLRRRLFDERLESLRSTVLQEFWPECYDGLMWLMRQPEYGERACEVLSLSPFFPVLHENKRLHGATDRSAKDLWLRFVQAKIAHASGEGSFETFEELKPWFNHFPEYRQDYLTLLQGEQEKARKETALLLQQSEGPECTVGEVRLIHASLRRKMTVLPVEERRELVRKMEERLARVIPEQDPGHPLEEYREALQIGNSRRAAYLRREIADTSALEAVDAEFAAAFHIALEPLALETSEKLPVDLTTDPPLALSCLAGHRTLFKEGADAYVMIDFAAKAACRMTSPVFARSRPFDFTPDGCFVFVEVKGEGGYGDRLWRAELSVERAVFTANFGIKEWFDLDDGFSVKEIMLSSERDTDYYLMVTHDEGRCPARIMRKRLAPKGTVETLQIGNGTDLKMWRCKSQPDRFILAGEGELRHVNRNLSLKARLRTTSKIYKIDRRNGYIFGLEECWLIQRGEMLELVKGYENAVSFGVWDPERFHGISIETDTALIVLGEGRQAFYNLSSNKFSEKIKVGRVIPSDEDGKWYCFDYSRKDGKLWLRDITGEIHTKLKWREFFIPRLNEKKRNKLLMWFNNGDNFVYRSEEWKPDGAAICW